MRWHEKTPTGTKNNQTAMQQNLPSEFSCVAMQSQVLSTVVLFFRSGWYGENSIDCCETKSIRRRLYAIES